ncbi:hypothetical protein [Mucilaginibacter sp. UYCu711]|uniref:hypothetical protein n=1 Tax=Mucilaginibacter sp. UYCu711 TaxID=3156339 RepID=UPI003D23ACE3
MKENILKYGHEVFKELIETYGFGIKTEINESQYFKIEYESKNFVIQIEQYRQEFYVLLYKTYEDDGVNLFNLLDYLKGSDAPYSDYFRKEKDIDDCYRKQFNHISNVIYENYSEIVRFFSEGDYRSKSNEFSKYWRSKHPEVYKTL